MEKDGFIEVWEEEDLLFLKLKEEEIFGHYLAYCKDSNDYALVLLPKMEETNIHYKNREKYIPPDPEHMNYAKARDLAEENGKLKKFEKIVKEKGLSTE